MAIRAVAPPGGWSVFVICMAKIAKEAAKAQASQGKFPKNC